MTTSRTRRAIGRPALALILVAAILLGTVSAALAEQEPETPRAIEWKSYREALNASREEDKPMMIHFTAPWCKWCTKMKRETYTDRRVIRYMNKNFTASIVDTEKLPSLARKYQVRSLPTLWFLDANGKPLTSVPGYVGADKLGRILEYIATKAYESADYETWLERRSKS